MPNLHRLLFTFRTAVHATFSSLSKTLSPCCHIPFHSTTRFEMASGIAIADACVEAFTALEKERKHSFLVLRISEDMSQITVEKTFPPKADDLEAEWKESIKVLPTNDCRYIVTDFRWKDGPTVTKSKICSILWAPDGAPMRSKMYVCPT